MVKSTTNTTQNIYILFLAEVRNAYRFGTIEDVYIWRIVILFKPNATVSCLINDILQNVYRKKTHTVCEQLIKTEVSFLVLPLRHVYIDQMKMRTTERPPYNSLLIPFQKVTQLWVSIPHKDQQCWTHEAFPALRQEKLSNCFL